MRLQDLVACDNRLASLAGLHPGMRGLTCIVADGNELRDASALAGRLVCPGSWPINFNLV